MPDSINQTLALLIDHDYLMAAVEPLDGKFELLKVAGQDRFHFYFFIQKLSQRVDYGPAYRQPFLDQKPDHHGDLLEQMLDPGLKVSISGMERPLTALLDGLVDDLRGAYFSHFEQRHKMSLDRGATLRARLVFMEGVRPEQRLVLASYLQGKRLATEESALSFAELLCLHLARKNRWDSQGVRRVVLEATGPHLHLQMVEAKSPLEAKATHKHTHENFGTDPRLRVLARRIVDDINAQEGILHGHAAREREYLRQEFVASQTLERNQREQSPYLSVRTSFAITGERPFALTLSLQEIENLTQLQVNQIGGFYETFVKDRCGVRPEDVRHVVLVGQPLNNQYIAREFARFGQAKLVPILSDQIDGALRELLATSGKASAGRPSEPIAPEPLKVLEVNQLSVGQVVRMNNNDPTPNKGNATQVLRYLGDSRFEVVSSTRSLLPGDIALSQTPIWAAGSQVFFEISRGGLKLGRFATRRVVSIDLL